MSRIASTPRFGCATSNDNSPVANVCTHTFPVARAVPVSSAHNTAATASWDRTAAIKQRPKQRHLLRPSHRTLADARRTQTLRRAISVCRFGEQRRLPHRRRSAERVSIQAQHRPKPIVLRPQRLDLDHRRRKPTIAHAIVSRTASTKATRPPAPTRGTTRSGRNASSAASQERSHNTATRARAVTTPHP